MKVCDLCESIIINAQNKGCDVNAPLQLLTDNLQSYAASPYSDLMINTSKTSISLFQDPIMGYLHIPIPMKVFTKKCGQGDHLLESSTCFNSNREVVVEKLVSANSRWFSHSGQTRHNKRRCNKIIESIDALSNGSQSNVESPLLVHESFLVFVIL